MAGIDAKSSVPDHGQAVSEQAVSQSIKQRWASVNGGTNGAGSWSDTLNDGSAELPPHDGDAIMVTKRTAKLAAGAAVLVALAGGRVAGAGDANWAADGNGYKPYDAVQGGTDKDKNPLYFCRSYQSDDYQPGRLDPALGTCNSASGGQEITSSAYEVLVPHWAAASDGQVPVGSFQAGTDIDGAPLYFCRGRSQGGVQPGKLKAGAGCSIMDGGQAVLLKDYQVMQDDLPIRTDPKHGGYPIIGGIDANHNPLPLCVASYGTGLQPGNIASDGRCHFSYGGAEVVSGNYSDVIPNLTHSAANAALDFVVGHDTNRPPAYVCTIDYNGSIQLGKYRSDFGGLCHVGYGGSEATGSAALLDGLSAHF
jgi:hypothetical protein